MAHAPQRPFVPPATPEKPRESARRSEFKVARPFVHGAPQAPAPTPQPARVVARSVERAADIPPPARVVAPPPPLPLVYDPPVDAVRSEAETLAPIQQFLHTETVHQEEIPGIGEYSYELPPVERFTDAQPDDGSFGPADNAPAFGEMIPDVPSDESTAEWSEAEWLQFDWRSAAALGEAGDPAASNAWLDTDWDKPPARPSATRETAAKAIADALDGIARRIREGELAIPSPGAVSTPADIAATLAALLGVKR